MKIQSILLSSSLQDYITHLEKYGVTVFQHGEKGHSTLASELDMISLPKIIIKIETREDLHSWLSKERPKSINLSVIRKYATTNIIPETDILVLICDRYLFKLFLNIRSARTVI